MAVLELGGGADLEVDPRVVEDEGEERRQAHGGDLGPHAAEADVRRVLHHGRRVVHVGKVSVDVSERVYMSPCAQRNVGQRESNASGARRPENLWGLNQHFPTYYQFSPHFDNKFPIPTN